MFVKVPIKPLYSTRLSSELPSEESESESSRTIFPTSDTTSLSSLSSGGPTVSPDAIRASRSARFCAKRC